MYIQVLTKIITHIHVCTHTESLKCIQLCILLSPPPPSLLRSHTLREVLVDLNNIAVAGSRVAEGKGRQLGMKVKGHRMFYLLDREGDFPSPKLFDTLIGARRL